MARLRELVGIPVPPGASPRLYPMPPPHTSLPLSFSFRLKPFLLRDRIFVMFPGEIWEAIYIGYEPPTLFF